MGYYECGQTSIVGLEQRCEVTAVDFGTDAGDYGH